MNASINLGTVIKDPNALRGLDRMADLVARVLDRHMRVPLAMPARKPDPKPLARTA